MLGILTFLIGDIGLSTRGDGGVIPTHPGPLCHSFSQCLNVCIPQELT